MRLTVVFEHWHLGDGNYPALAVGDEARLSFEVHASGGAPAPQGEPTALRQLRDADYELTARFVRSYDYGSDVSELRIFEAGWLLFYTTSPDVPRVPLGSIVRLRGIILVDHYLWVEFPRSYPDSPDLLYNLRVVGVRWVPIPTRFISRNAHSEAYPSSVPPGEYEPATVESVGVVGGRSGVPGFSLLELERLPAGEGPSQPTFLGSRRV